MCIQVGMCVCIYIVALHGYAYDNNGGEDDSLPPNGDESHQLLSFPPIVQFIS